MNTKNWLEELGARCQHTSQKKVADKLHVSAALINQVLKGKYPGDLNRIQQLVEGAFMQYSVNCPVLGEITKHKCLFHQDRPFAATNPQRVMLHKACRSGCSHSLLEQTISNQIKVKVIDGKQTPKPINAEFYGVKQVLSAIQNSATSRTQLIEMLIQEMHSLAKQYNKLVQEQESTHA